MTEIDLSRHSQKAPSMDPLESVVWGYRFTETGDSEELKGATLRAAIERQDSWIWLHFDLTDSRAATAINSLPMLPADAVEVLLSTDDHQRIATFDHAVAGVVADFERADTIEVRQMVRWHFCMAPHLFISARRRPLLTLNSMQNAIQSGKRLLGVADLFLAIIHAFAAAMAALVLKYTDTLDDVEDGLLDAKEAGDYESLGLVRRSAVRLHRQAVPLRAMLRHLLEDRPPWFTDEAAAECEAMARRIDSLCADLQSLQERAHALQDELSARQTDQTNNRLTTLSVVATLLMPPTLVSGIYGMNVEGLPFKDQPWAFGFTVVMLVGSVLTGLFVLRRMKLV
jgi:zinc transporter